MVETTDSAPGAVVPLGEIDLDDRTFEIRRAEAPPENAALQVAAIQMRPLLWRRAVPYRILRGFSILDRLVVELKARATSTWQSHRVEVAFLEDIQHDPSPISAMIAACIGRPARPFDLSTVECARAVRRLMEMQSTTKDIQDFLSGISAPRRTQVRAMKLAMLASSFWELLEEGKLTVRQAEAIAAVLSGTGTHRIASEGHAEMAREILQVLGGGRR